MVPYLMIIIYSPMEIHLYLELPNRYFKYLIFNETQDSRGAPAKRPPPDYFL